MATIRKSLKMEPSWEKIVENAKDFGWFPDKFTDTRIVLERGKQRIIALRIPQTKKWKILYFSGKVMDDLTCFDTSRWAKGLMMEMAMFKQFKISNSTF